MILGFDIGGTKCAVITANVNDGEIKLLKKEKCATRFDISPEEMIDGLIRSAENILECRHCFRTTLMLVLLPSGSSARAWGRIIWFS